MKRHALFVGVNSYDDKTIRPLRFSVPDASVLQDRFRGLGYETRLLPDPSAAELRNAVEESVEGLGPGDVFLFFFAGHGFTAQDGQHLLFCRDDRQKLLRVNGAGVRVDELELLTEDGGFHRAFLLDSCRSDCLAGRETRGGETRDLDFVSPAAHVDEEGSFFLLRSCDRFRPSLEFSALGHGLFTQGLLDALDARDPRLARCGTDFLDAVRERMEALQVEPDPNGPQRPSLGECSGPAFSLFGPAFVPTPVVSRPAFVPIVEPAPAEAVPFDFEWNGRAEAADGSAGRVSFRLRARCDLEKAGVGLAGASVPPVVFATLRTGEVREGVFEAVPEDVRVPSAFRVEAAFGCRVRERFCADPAARADPDGEGGRPVRFLPESIRHEAARLRAPDAALEDLLVLPGSDLLRFGGRPSRRNDVVLDGAPPVVSRGQFSLLLDRARGEVLLRDGVPDAGKPGSWIPSAHGASVDGIPLLSPLPLAPNRRFALSLAPRAMPEEPFRLSFETTGWDVPAAADWPFRDGSLSSLLVRREDAPRRPILVVWGAAALDPVLGTSSGLRVVSLRGRLHLADSDGTLRRLPFLTGRVLPRTPYAVL